MTDAAPADLAQRIVARLRDVPDFPKPGIVFKDITPLLGDAETLTAVIDALADRYRGRVEMVAGIESRGFVLGAPLAVALGVGFVPVRKTGKLPATVISRTYDLEYGSATLEVHADALRPGQRVVVVDDVLATGGTAAAACNLVQEAGGVVVAFAVLLELAFLHGRDRLTGRSVDVLLTVDD